MLTGKSRALLLVCGALALGASVSALKLAWYCRNPASEACVWGKAYRAISLPLETLLVAGIVGAVYLMLRSRRPD